LGLYVFEFTVGVIVGVKRDKWIWFVVPLEIVGLLTGNRIGVI